MAGYVFSFGAARLLEASRRDAMAWRWAYEWAVGASVREFVSVMIPWRIRSLGASTRVVMVWWWNSTVSEIFWPRCLVV